jgi:hypothetical protein
MEGGGGPWSPRASGLCRWTTLRLRCRPAAGVPVSPAGAVMAQLGERMPRGASRGWRQRPRGQQGSSYFCCPAAIRGGGTMKERPLLLARFSSRSPSGGQAPVSPGRPRHQEPELPRLRQWWWRRRRLRGPPKSSSCGSPSGVRVSGTWAASPAPRFSSRSLLGDRAPASPEFPHL